MACTFLGYHSSLTSCWFNIFFHYRGRHRHAVCWARYSCCRIPSESLLPNRAVEHGAIDDPGRDLAAAQFEHCLHISRADALEHLVCPAQGMRGDNDIVEFENGVVGMRRLRIKDVKSRAGNAALLKDIGQGSLVDHWAAGAIDEEGCWLHHAEAPCID